MDRVPRRAGALPRLHATLALLAVALVRPAPAGAAPAPDAPRLAALQAASDSAWRVRVVSRRVIYLLRRPEFGPRGVNVTPRSSGPPALFTIGEPADEAKWIPWAEIERLETGKNVSGRGALKGLLIGGVAGGTLVAAKGPDLADEDDNIVALFAVTLTLGCGLAGYLLGLANPDLTPLYP